MVFQFISSKFVLNVVSGHYCLNYIRLAEEAGLGSLRRTGMRMTKSPPIFANTRLGKEFLHGVGLSRIINLLVLIYKFLSLQEVENWSLTRT